MPTDDQLDQLGQAVSLSPSAIRVAATHWFKLVEDNALQQAVEELKSEKAQLKSLLIDLNKSSQLIDRDIYRAKARIEKLPGLKIAQLAQALRVPFSALADISTAIEHKKGRPRSDCTWKRISKDRNSIVRILVVPAPPLWGPGSLDGVVAKIVLGALSSNRIRFEVELDFELCSWASVATADYGDVVVAPTDDIRARGLISVRRLFRVGLGLVGRKGSDLASLRRSMGKNLEQPLCVFQNGYSSREIQALGVPLSKLNEKRVMDTTAMGLSVLDKESDAGVSFWGGITAVLERHRRSMEIYPHPIGYFNYGVWVRDSDTRFADKFGSFLADSCNRCQHEIKAVTKKFPPGTMSFCWR